MCAYDTTLDETLQRGQTQPKRPGDEPECLRRDNLTSDYFPQTGRTLLLAIVALCAIFVLTGLNRLNYTDLWGHLNFGRWIVEQGRLPTADPFAAIATEAGFLNLPWLAQVAGYLTYQWLGVDGLALMHAVLVTLGCGLMMVALRRRGASLGVATLGAVIGFILSAPIVGTIRPQLFGMVGVPLVLYACSDLADRRRALLWLPVMFAMWANLHGSFAIGLAILGIHAACVCGAVVLKERSAKGLVADKLAMNSLLAVAMATVASCINPIGPRLLIAVALFGSHSGLAQISEWRTLPLASLSGILFYGSVILGVIAIRMGGRKLEIRDIALALLFGVLTVSAMRMLVWWAVIWPWVLAPHLIGCWEKLRAGRAADSPADQPAPEPSKTSQSTGREASMRTIIAMGFVFTTLLLAPPSHALISGRPRGLAAAVSTETPLYIADELARRRVQEPLFAPMDWADYLTWHTNAGPKPLVYSHVHLSSPEVWHDYQRLAAGQDDWLEIANRYQLRYLVVSRKRNPQLKRQLDKAARSAKPPVRIIYRDAKSVLAEVL